ncbi:sodium:solute symporter family protein [Nocardia sp. NEAU-G5]|uniref:Sodium:solute symporter family protein n=1 Tax=Nocardia albiluteola TaxID=2842303 RepID=A0ABS6B5F6_9NOCA|nr:sodium:solute symporter family protein [Nocardia albiluteola]MBU3065010.1 sodium:solute symporter family protein [Nocardia albiluteola]
MSVTLTITILGMIVIAAVGLLGRRRPALDLAEWSVAGRSFGSVTMWFLQAGEVFTTFTFLGMAGLAFSGGAAASYSLPYIPLACVIWYFVGPRVWNLGRQHGYLTQADYYEERYGSRALGVVIAVCAVVFMLPYLQLQITGLGLIIKLVTHDSTSSTWGEIIGTVLTAAFVLWAGIRGTAATSYLKDALMLLAVAIVVVAVPIHFTGGIGHAFHTIQQVHPSMLTVHSGPNDKVWWTTSMLASMLGAGFFTFPHTWPAVLSAGSARGLRRNWVMLPLYQVTLLFPIIVGFIGIVALPKKTSANGVLLTLTNGALPSWVVGLIAVGGAAAAMVPAAVMVLGMSTMVARNVVRSSVPRVQFYTNHGVVLVILGLALVLDLTRPNALANLLLLTYSGLVQFVPGFIAGLRDRPLVGRNAVLWGIVAGEAFVIWVTFWKIGLANVNAGIVALGVNLVVMALVEAVLRLRNRAETQSPSERAGEPSVV